MADTSSKTEKATPQRVKKARKEGQIARSPELTSWLGLLVSIYMLEMTFKRGNQFIMELWRSTGEAMTLADERVMLRLFGQGMWGVITTVGPLMIALFALAIVGNVAQVGFVLTSKPMKPKLSRLNPFAGIKKMFSPHTGWEMLKSLLKILILGGVAWSTLAGLVPQLTQGGPYSVWQVVAVTGKASLDFGRTAAIMGLVLATTDFIMQKRRINKSLKMSKQEIKEEGRAAEGDPHMKGAIRSKQRQMSANRMMAAVSKADVVLVNPTHIAIALSYESTRGAPRVVAMGAGAVATKIREEAQKHNVPMVEDKPLARTIYKVCDVGDEIPANLFEAVARLLAFIFSLKQRTGMRSTGMILKPPVPLLAG